MKKFIYKFVIFFIPILILHLFVYIYYSPDKGDIFRVGYVINLFPDYRDAFLKDDKKELKVISIRNVDSNREYDLLTIGDSFSDQGTMGYQNFLALNNGIKIVHLDRHLQTNQFQALIGLLNSGFFENYKFKSVLLQFIEAGSIGVVRNLDWDFTFPEVESLDSLKSDFDQFTTKFKFPSDRVVKFPYYNLKRVLFPELDCNKVYSLPLKENVFSVRDPTLYFHSSNPKFINNSSEQEIVELNIFLNLLAEKLRERGVELIVMPVPDKLDFYFDKLEYSGQFEKTKFFEIIKPLKKKYLYVDSLEILETKGNNKKDIYYYDDTHWSPVGVEILGKSIFQSIYASFN